MAGSLCGPNLTTFFSLSSCTKAVRSLIFLSLSNFDWNSSSRSSYLYSSLKLNYRMPCSLTAESISFVRVLSFISGYYLIFCKKFVRCVFFRSSLFPCQLLLIVAPIFGIPHSKVHSPSFTGAIKYAQRTAKVHWQIWARQCTVVSLSTLAASESRPSALHRKGIRPCCTLDQCQSCCARKYAHSNHSMAGW